MNRLTSFILGIVVGALGLFLSENYYVVRSEETFHLIPKVAAKLDMPYRDIRGYTVEDWQNNPSLALAIVKADKQSLMAESGLNQLRRQFQGALDSFGGT